MHAPSDSRKRNEIEKSLVLVGVVKFKSTHVRLYALQKLLQLAP